jgi:NADPH-dependent 2,4-dienoyl-CoA reductase/sulfur reductase-like enzyme
MTCVIVGGGMAGFQAAMTCRTLWPDRAVTLVDAENDVGYYRTLLPQFMAGTLQEDRLFFWRGASDPLLTVRAGVRATFLDRPSRSLLLATGEALSYDRLILAHGGHPRLPEILAGSPCRGIFPVRDLTVARSARSWLVDHRKVVVLGGSLVGVKTAVHLRQAGFEVVVVVRRGHVLLRALSAEAAATVEVHLQKLGIRLCLGAALEELRVTGDAIAAVKAGGVWLEADALLVAAGIVPDTAFLEASGLLTDGRLVVSPTLQTADPRIFAAGDAALIGAPGGQPVGLNTWAQAVGQGRTAAANLYRPAPVPHVDLTAINVMDLSGLAMAVLGPPVGGAEVIAHARPEERVRRELFLDGGKAVGGALIGDISAAGPLHALMAGGLEARPGLIDLLRPRMQAAIRFPQRAGRRRALILSQPRASA